MRIIQITFIHLLISFIPTSPTFSHCFRLSIISTFIRRHHHMCQIYTFVSEEKINDILFYSILFYSLLFSSILFYSILFYSILFYSILFYSIIFYSILLQSITIFCYNLKYSFLFILLLYNVYPTDSCLKNIEDIKLLKHPTGLGTKKCFHFESSRKFWVVF